MQDAWGDSFHVEPDPQKKTNRASGSSSYDAKKPSLRPSGTHDSSRSTIADETSKELNETLRQLRAETSLLRDKLDARDKLQTTVMYGVSAIVLVLLILVVQSYNKLNHAAECMLWYVSRRV
tara:strand:+ start:127 stop:492 length:366 start_codon:yes stop_codon:yes gene_type:complete